MKARLLRIYIFQVIPAVLLVLGMPALKYLGLEVPALPPWACGAVFVLSAITALAGPILFRAAFAHAHRTRTGVSEQSFFRFQRRLLCTALVTPYIAAAALVFQFPRFHAAGIVLMAFYAVYYYYPSRRRLDFDKKLFRVNHGSETEG